MELDQQDLKNSPAPRSHAAWKVGAKTRQAVEHHYDDARPGKPLYLMMPGGLVALASLALIVFIIYRVWIERVMAQASGVPLLILLAPLYIGGVFLFSYGYELYNVSKALRLTAIVVFLTLAAVVIVAALVFALGAMGSQGGPGSSRRSRRRTSSGQNGSGGGGGFGWGMFPFPIFFGGLGMPGRTVTREVVREEPAAPPEPESVACPYCGTSYVPTETEFACPACGAPTPKELLPLESRA
jgi:hypothetical protein